MASAVAAMQSVVPRSSFLEAQISSFLGDAIVSTSAAPALPHFKRTASVRANKNSPFANKVRSQAEVFESLHATSGASANASVEEFNGLVFVSFILERTSVSTVSFLHRIKWICHSEPAPVPRRVGLSGSHTLYFLFHCDASL